MAAWSHVPSGVSVREGALPSGIRNAAGTHPTGLLSCLKKINLFQVMKQPVLATGLSNGTSNSTSNTVSDMFASNAVGITTPRPLTTLTTLFKNTRMHSPADRNGVQRPLFCRRYREIASRLVNSDVKFRALFTKPPDCLPPYRTGGSP